MIYLDNAATSWPKPEGTIEAMTAFMRYAGGSPGRSGHTLSIEAARIILEARTALAELFAVADPLRIAFTPNATFALNFAMMGMLRPGDHVVSSSIEHNSVMRPLHALERKGVEVSLVPCTPQGEIDPSDVERALRPNTRLIVMTHASNVLGTLTPLQEIGAVARNHRILFCVDAAQTAGSVLIDVERMGIDILVFTGHKMLYGPPGTGGIYLRCGIEELVEPIIRGGTGSRSEDEEQPGFMPDMFESGTPNGVGIAGLGAGVRFVLSRGVSEIRRNEVRLIGRLLDGLRAIKGVTLYGTTNPEAKIAVVCFNIEGLEPSTVAAVLDSQFRIMTRAGLHCSPAAHRVMGTYPRGAVRLSLGLFTTEEEIDTALEAIHKIASSRKG